MKSQKNLTRFTYERTAFEGWRLCLSRAGTTFTKYFSDRHFGSEKESLAAAEKAREELIRLVESSRRVNGKLSKTTISKGKRLLNGA